MPRVFFLSYARSRGPTPDAPDYVDQFEHDLTTEVSSQLRGDGFRVGFRDTRNIEAGTPDWSRELADQLVAYPIGIVLLSPAYFEHDRPWCKWECDYLRSRNEAIANLSAVAPQERPRAFLLLDWIGPADVDVPVNAPDSAQKVGESIAQNNPDDLNAVRYVLQAGLRSTLHRVKAGDQASSQSYTKFVQVFAQYVVAQYRRWRAIEQHCRDLPLPPAFDSGNRWEHAQPTSVPKQPLEKPPRKRKVYVVYIAAHPEEVSPSRVHRYAEDGEYDWKPFAGATARDGIPRVGDFANMLEDIEIVRWQFDYFRDHMKDALKSAGRRYPILIVVDPWTATQLDRYRRALKSYPRAETEQGAFSAPLVIWNEDDPDALNLRAAFEQQVGTLFDRHRWEPVAKPEEFGYTLSSVVALLQRRIRNALAAEGPDNGSPPVRISAAG